VWVGFFVVVVITVYRSLIRNTADKIQIQEKKEHKIQDTMMKIV